MPVNVKRVAALVRRANKPIPSRMEPPLGALQATILKTMHELGEEAVGFKALERLITETGEWFDPSLVYGTIRKLAKELKYLEPAGTQPSSDGGPPLKVYRVTAAGRAAIKATAAYHRAVAERLER